MQSLKINNYQYSSFFWQGCAIKKIAKKFLSRVLITAGITSALFFPLEQMVWASSHGFSAMAGYHMGMKGKNITLHNGAVRSGPLTKGHLLSPPLRNRHILLSSMTRLPLLAGGQMAMPSYANNFHGGSATVDLKTGTAPFSLTIAGGKKLVLRHSGLSRGRPPNPFGLGPHWNWNLGIEYHSPIEAPPGSFTTTEVSSSNGHHFTMLYRGRGVWRPLHKLYGLTIKGWSGHWTLSMANGVREHLKNGYEDWEETKNGKRVWFYYNKKGMITQQLACISTHPLTLVQVINGPAKACKDLGGVWLTYKNKRVTVHNGQQQIVIVFSNGWKRIEQIITSSLSNQGVK